jgi:hypothetical protein
MIVPGLFFIAAGIICLLAARASGRNSLLIADAMAGRTMFTDGRRVAVMGTIESEMEPMRSPARNLPSLLYAYLVSHPSRQSHETTDFHGRGMIPCYVASGIRKIRLIEFPVLGHFPAEAVDDAGAAERLASRTESAPLALTPPLIRPGREELSAGRAWSFDGRVSSSRLDPAQMNITEQIVPPRHRVIAIGNYVAAESALERVILLNDERETAFERAGRQTKFWRIAGFVAIAIGIAFFVAEALT